MWHQYRVELYPHVGQLSGIRDRFGNELESQVSRDERNEYHGITVERVSRILDALGVQLTSRFDEPVLSRASRSHEGRVHG
jgi:hypothetical protein